MPKQRNGFSKICSRKILANRRANYLKERGIDRKIASNWQIGFAPDSWDAFLKWALDRGYRRGADFAEWFGEIAR